ncbi:hypothetical protein ACP70R_029630 [Stipagrostis hirtigluma subsp. patula]
MAMAALSTSALSSLEAMLHSLMRGSEEGGSSDDAPVDDTLASPPPPPLPARPTPRGRRPSRRMVRATGRRPPSPPSPPPPSPSKDDARPAAEASLVAELERKAVVAEARLRRKEEENAALKRRIESYHVRWLEYEIKIKSLEEAFHEQVAALQIVQDAARRAEAAARDRRESSASESHMKMSEDASARLRHGRDRDRAVARRNSAVSRLSSEFRRQSQALEHGAAALAAEPPRPAWQPSGNAGDDLKKLKAQFRAWKKEYKTRLRKAKAEIDKDRRRRASCWI